MGQLIEKAKYYYIKHKEIVLYLIFGGLTTAVSYIFFGLCSWGLGLESWLSTSIAWVFAVAFAFVTNKIFVFGSQKKSGGGLLKEVSLFVSARLISGAVNVAVMYWLVDILHYNELLIFTLCQIFIIVFNYVASKAVIFKK